MRMGACFQMSRKDVEPELSGERGARSGADPSHELTLEIKLKL